MAVATKNKVSRTSKKKDKKIPQIILEEQRLSNLLEKIKTAFNMRVAPKGECYRFEVGRALLDAKDRLKSNKYLTLFREWLRNDHNLSFKYMDVAIRVAKGELEEEVARKLTLTKSVTIPKDRIPRMNDRLPIIGDNGPTEKMFRDMTKSEITRNFSEKGHDPGYMQKAKQSRIFPVKAQNVKFQKGNIVLEFTDNNTVKRVYYPMEEVLKKWKKQNKKSKE